MYIFTLMPLAASVLQYFAHGISLINISLATVVVLLFLFSLIDVSNEAEKAKNIENY